MAADDLVRAEDDRGGAAGGRRHHQPPQRPDQKLRGEHVLGVDGGRLQRVRVGGAVAAVLRRDPGQVLLGRARVLHVFAGGGGLRFQHLQRVQPRLLVCRPVMPDADDDVGGAGGHRVPARVQGDGAEPATALEGTAGLTEHVVATEVEAGITRGDRDAVDFLGADAGVGQRRAHRLAGQRPRPARAPR